MVNVEINYNNNEVRITSDFDKQDVVIKVTRPSEIESVLVELLNIVNVSAVTLSKVNEDVSSTISEW